jgi:hypothetical protein
VTEIQLLAIPEFATVPIYDESDPESATITSASAGGKYRSVRECSTLREVRDCLKNPQLVPLGALRAEAGGGQVVVAYFGEQL